MVVLANERTRADGGQAHHFRLCAPKKVRDAIDCYTNEVNRLFGVMNKRLASHEACVGWA
jgi:GST-like protein